MALRRGACPRKNGPCLHQADDHRTGSRGHANGRGVNRSTSLWGGTRPLRSLGWLVYIVCLTIPTSHAAPAKFTPLLSALCVHPTSIWSMATGFLDHFIRLPTASCPLILPVLIAITAMCTRISMATSSSRRDGFLVNESQDWMAERRP